MLLVSCSSPYKITKPDPYYPADTKLTEKEKHIWKITDLSQFQEALFVRRLDPESIVKPLNGGFPEPISGIRGKPATWAATSKNELDEFFRASFDNIGYFKVVKHYDQLKQSPKLQQDNHLVADYSVSWEGGYDYIFNIRIINPRNNEILLYVSHEHYRFWPSLDYPLFFPVFNAVIEWKDECILRSKEK